MWNSKRILLLGLGFFVFMSSYAVYAYFLGGIDGLPPLPRALLRLAGMDSTADPPPPTEPEVDRKLKLAWGDNCDEIKRAIKLDLKKKGLVLAADEAKIMENGQVRLSPFRLSIFKKQEHPDNKFPEINTIKSNVALLTFDQPITNFTEINNRKIIGAEIKGNIVIVNNRHTPQKMDDIVVRVDGKPMYYDEKLNKVWSAGHVQLVDLQTQPHPTRILGKGLELFLTHEDPKAKPKPKPKPRGDAINGVDEIALLADVVMHLYPEESGSGFPGSTNASRKPASVSSANKKGTKQERSHVMIQTPGRFRYDVPKDLATFETPPGAYDQVAVTRQILRDKAQKSKQGEDFDHLVCDRLELQFRRKENAPVARPADTSSTGSDREIESAHATARPGNYVVLSMDTEKLDAHCDELLYECATPKRGPQTVLKGKGRPMWAMKEGHKIQARELTLTGADTKGNDQRLEALGPGQVDLYDPKNQAKPYQVHAFWQELLVSTKARVGDRMLDLLTFTGQAVFQDEAHDQELEGEKLQVWLEPNEPPPAGAPPKSPESAQNDPGQRLHKVEAFDRVRARSPEMSIKDCEHLRVLFQNSVTTLPDNVASAKPAALPTPHTVEKPATTTATTLPPAAPPTARGKDLPAPPPTTADARKPAEPTKPKKPIDLWGQSVVAYVTRVGPKNELREMQAEGKVHVHQDGSQPGDKGVDVKGDRLRLVRETSGDILDVYGDAYPWAQLQMGDLNLLGPKVRIDQQKNLAWVEGAGGMTMPSKTTFDGSKSTNPDSVLHVTWVRSMLFNGKDAEFYGSVTASQDSGTLKSAKLYVTLDKTVSFKEGQKGGQGAKAERVVASGQVYVVESKFAKDKTSKSDKEKLVQYQRLIAREVATRNQEGQMIATGYGKVYSLQPGSSEDPLETKPGQPASKPAPPADPKKTGEKAKEDEMFLTRIEFDDQMNTFEETVPRPGEKHKRRKSIFYGNVKVLRVPSEDPDVAVDTGRLPPGGMYMQSEVLTVYEWTLPDGKKTQVMCGERRVFLKTPEFYGNADVVIYDKNSETITFRSNTGMATLYRRKGGTQGQQADNLRGRTIMYNRKTNECHVEGSTGINVR